MALFKLYLKIQGKCNLPNEIFDNILIKLGNFKLAIQLKNEYVINKLYNPKIHTWNYAASNGYLHVIRWLHGS